MTFPGGNWVGARLLALSLASIPACKSAPGEDPPAGLAPTAVSCADAAQLKQRAIDDRRLGEEQTSDRERIYIGKRAAYFASLAVIAELKCKVTLAEADEALEPAFEAARKAEATRSMYEMALAWGEADLIATDVIALLIKQLPAPPPGVPHEGHEDSTKVH